MRKESLGTSVIVILIISLTLITVNITSPTGPVVSIDPPTISKLVGSTFDINLTVTNVTDLYGWQFNLTFNPSVLNCTDVEEGPFLQQAGTTWLLPMTINNDVGFVFFGATLFPAPGSGASGNGTLATMTFAALDNDTSALHFLESKLNGWDPVDKIPVPISHTAVDGSVTTTLGHDVAVVNITAQSVTYPNLNVTINATVKNEGSFSEKVNVTLRYETTLIGNETVNLVIWQSSNVSFTWNTTGISYGNYTLNATATVLNSIQNPGGIDDDLADNTLGNTTIVVTILGDMDGDGGVDSYDFYLFSGKYGSSVGDPTYIPEADMDGDGDVDSYDFYLFSGKYGQTI
jgi:hypothetical protein